MALIDNILNEINAALTTNLDWLTTAYGKCQRLTKYSDGRRYNFPGVYVQEHADNYISFLPDSTLGNYSYWEVDDPQRYERIGVQVRPEFEAKLVIWFHWPEVYDDWQDREIEEVKAQVINVLVNSYHTTDCEVYEVMEDADNIYQGFSHENIDRQFLMKPYGGLAIRCKIVGSDDCFTNGETPEIPPLIYPRLPFNHSLVQQVYPVEKWFGQDILVRTWYFETGTGDYQELTGFNFDDYKLIPGRPAMMSFRHNVSGDETVQAVEVIRDGSGGKVFTLDFVNEIFITLYYTPR